MEAEIDRDLISWDSEYDQLDKNCLVLYIVPDDLLLARKPV